MNFLNEISSRYPEAVSLAAGRPAEQFFEIDSLQRYLNRFCQHLQDDLGYSEEQVRRTLFQYGRTKGVVHGLIAANLARDEGITVDPESIVVTVGCQEAMFLILRALRTSPSDVLLAVTPTYVGLTGAARLVELPVLPVAAGPGGVDLDDLRDQLDRARAAGLRPRACYVMPDFANPSGVSMDLADRKRLLAIAAEEGILLLEDNPYGLFPHADSQRQPTLKALDEQRTVVYLGSFAKTAMPGVRVGYLVADQSVVDSTGGRSLLADQLSKLKSMLTVNTSPIAQAIVGGKLLDNDCSLLRANERERAVYTANMRQMVAGLAARFPDPDLGVRWNVPIGGFFVVVTRSVRRRRRPAGTLGGRLRRAVDVDAPLLRTRGAGARAAAQLQHRDARGDRARTGPGGQLDQGPARRRPAPLAPAVSSRRPARRRAGPGAGSADRVAVAVGVPQARVVGYRAVLQAGVESVRTPLQARVEGVRALVHVRVQRGGALLESLRLGPLPLGLGQPLLGIALAVGGPQLGFGALTAGPGSLLLGRGLRRFGPRGALVGLFEVLLGLDSLALGGLAAHPGQQHSSEHGQYHQDDDDDDESFHGFVPSVGPDANVHRRQTPPWGGREGEANQASRSSGCSSPCRSRNSHDPE